MDYEAGYVYKRRVCVAAAGAVVTKDVLAYAVVGGVPAHSIIIPQSMIRLM